jgi:hypothetical protein
MKEVKPELFKVYLEPNIIDSNAKIYHFPYKYESAGVKNMVVTRLEDGTFYESTWQFSHYKVGIMRPIKPWELIDPPKDVKREFIDTAFTRDGKRK